jgi:hypothetical protein
MHKIIESKHALNRAKPPYFYRSDVNFKSRTDIKDRERQSSGFTREELRQIVAEQID